MSTRRPLDCGICSTGSCTEAPAQRQVGQFVATVTGDRHRERLRERTAIATGKLRGLQDRAEASTGRVQSPAWCQALASFSRNQVQCLAHPRRRAPPRRAS
jgi:hypothetical protein